MYKFDILQIPHVYICSFEFILNNSNYKPHSYQQELSEEQHMFVSFPDNFNLQPGGEDSDVTPSHIYMDITRTTAERNKVMFKSG